MGDTSISTDRLGLEVLSNDECWRLLAETPVGRVAFVEAGEPIVLPVTPVVSGHGVYFRSAPGSKLEAASMGRTIAYEVDGWDAAEHSGWSVLARGLAETVYDEETVARLDDAEGGPWLDAARRGTWVRVRVEEVSGRRLG